jgi:hypothetical protein
MFPPYPQPQSWTSWFPGQVPFIRPRRGLVQSTFTVIRCGECCIHNESVRGYNVYIGVNQLPDFTAPTSFSTILPVSLPYAAPGVGTDTYYVVVRKVNSLGLESVNQVSMLVVVNSSGDHVLTPVSDPVNLRLIEQADRLVRVLATYPGYSQDSSPATTWKVWAGLTTPNPAVDLPIYTQTVTGSILAINLAGSAGDTLHVAVGLYRDQDDSLSGVITGTITLSIDPDRVEVVPSGYEEE